MENTTQGINNIPDCILAWEIFSRLPAKTLIRFTAVCKSWSSLIINPQFIAAHLSRMKLSEFNKVWCLNLGVDSYTILSEDKPACKDQHEQSKLMLPSGFHCEGIIGRSCHGLLCLIMSCSAGWGIFLWNPSIRKFKTLQTFFYSGSRNIFYVYGFGFGYHEPSKDYKVIKITFASDKVDIYSLSTDSWHEVQSVRVPRSLKKNFMTGMSLDWLTKNEVDRGPEYLKSIVSFDFNEETFKEIILPSEMQVEIDLFVGINQFKGSIAILLADFLWGEQYCLWVMNEYGVTEPWIKTMISITAEIYHWPLLFTKDGTILLQKSSHDQLVLYGLEDHKIKYIFGNLRLFGDIIDFTESFLLADYEDDWLMHQTGGFYCGRHLRYKAP